MTLHAAKGLEFNHVFLPGWEEGLFPHQRSLDEKGKEGLEEERRLAYVGITRAKKTITISHAGSRRIYNQWQSNVPSRFVDELPKEHVEVAGGIGQGSVMLGNRQEAIGIKESFTHASCPMPNAFSSGTRIFHQKFGYGVIIRSHGDTLEIVFEKAGIKKVKAAFVEKP
jgi:DNA helicase-2/ATP-dependent DNA helicase PcrA